MNAMERFGTVLQGGLPDRVPILGSLFEQGARELGLSIREYYSKPEYVAEGQLRLRDRYGYDNLNAFYYAGKTAEMLGCRHIIFSDYGPPNVGHMIIQQSRDIETLEIPTDLPSLPAFADVAECVRILRDQAGGSCPIGGTVVGSFSLPALLMGIERWMELLFTGPESLRRELLQKCSDFCISEIKALRATGVDAVSYSNPVASVDVLSPSQFEELALEWLVRDISAVGPEGIVYVNGGGRINPIIDSVMTATGIQVFYINPLDDVAVAKQTIGKRGISSGVINDILMLDWSAEEIDDEVKRIMTAGAPGGRFLFGTMVMPYMIPEHSIQVLFDSARRHGSYAETEAPNPGQPTMKEL